MDSKLQIASRILDLNPSANPAALFQDALNYQYVNNAVYRSFVQGIYPNNDRANEDLLFMPVELFKHHKISCRDKHELVFRSSGTTQEGRSSHHVYSASWYEKVSRKHFENLYGSLDELVILALLPSYLEAGDSSLVHMVQYFISCALPESRFVLHEPQNLEETLKQLKNRNQRTILFGVSYALLDFAEKTSIDFPELTIMETGGMKGRRVELTRDQLHAEIKRGFPSSDIHSEYGMTELLSQAYCQDGTWFTPPPWMIPFVTEISDPLNQLSTGRRGLLAFIDLANYESCSFLQTKDIGMVNEQGQFLVEGRLDHSDVRGCNLLYT